MQCSRLASYTQLQCHLPSPSISMLFPGDSRQPPNLGECQVIFQALHHSSSFFSWSKPSAPGWSVDPRSQSKNVPLFTKLNCSGLKVVKGSQTNVLDKRLQIPGPKGNEAGQVEMDWDKMVNRCAQSTKTAALISK